VVPAPKAAVWIRGDERNLVGSWRLDQLQGDLRRSLGESAEPVLLPPADECADARIVGDRRPRCGEREAAAGALLAASHGPGGRRATAVTKRSTNSRKPRTARRTYLDTRQTAHDTPPREQDTE
jgi:hypothetical protein